VLEGQGEVHLDLQRRAQPLGQQLDRARIHDVSRLAAVLRAGLHEPADELAAMAGHALILLVPSIAFMLLIVRFLNTEMLATVG